MGYTAPVKLLVKLLDKDSCEYVYFGFLRVPWIPLDSFGFLEVPWDSLGFLRYLMVPWVFWVPLISLGFLMFLGFH